MTDEEALKRIASNVKHLREEAGLSMGQLARRVGTYPANIKRIEDHENMPGVGLLTRLAEAFEVSMDDLVAEQPAKILARSY